MYKAIIGVLLCRVIAPWFWRKMGPACCVCNEILIFQTVLCCIVKPDCDARVYNSLKFSEVHCLSCVDAS